MKPIGTTTYRPLVLGFAQHAPPLLLARATFATLSPPPATPPPRSPQLTWPARRGPSAQALAAAQPGLAQWAKPSERRRRPAAQEVAIGPQPAELGPKQLDQLPVALDLTLLELARPGGC